MLAAWCISIGAAEAGDLPGDAPSDVAPGPRLWRFAGFPIATYSSDKGFGYGLFGSLVHDDAREETPYVARVALTLYRTTNEYEDHKLELDFPAVFGSKYRWDLLVGYEAWKQAPYFGWGNTAPVREDAPVEFNEYDVRWLRAMTNLRRDVAGPWDLFGTYLVRLAAVSAFDDSLLDDESPAGVEGGRYASLGVGVMYDTRDQEPSPTSGAFTEVSVRASHPFVGSQWTVFGANFTDRRWLSLDPNGRLVLANRVIVDVRRGDEPFFMASVLGGSEFVEIGGSDVLRGLVTGRYRGDVALLWTPELRWRYGHIWRFELMAVPFVDVGRVLLWPDHQPGHADFFAELDYAGHLHVTGGVGQRVQLGSNLVARLDVGVGVEETARALGEVDPAVPVESPIERRPSLGIHLVLDHPF